MDGPYRDDSTQTEPFYDICFKPSQKNPGSYITSIRNPRAGKLNEHPYAPIKGPHNASRYGFVDRSWDGESTRREQQEEADETIAADFATRFLGQLVSDTAQERYPASQFTPMDLVTRVASDIAALPDFAGKITVEGSNVLSNDFAFGDKFEIKLRRPSLNQPWSNGQQYTSSFGSLYVSALFGLGLSRILAENDEMDDALQRAYVPTLFDNQTMPYAVDGVSGLRTSQVAP